MESEDVSEKVEWESKRIAAAFQVMEWKRKITTIGNTLFIGHDADSHHVRCSIGQESARVNMAEVGVRGTIASCGFEEERICWVDRSAEFDEHLARGMYRLGYECAEIERELGITFSHHEKMELRLPMPRKFWRKAWVDEEGS